MGPQQFRSGGMCIFPIILLICVMFILWAFGRRGSGPRGRRRWGAHRPGPPFHHGPPHPPFPSPHFERAPLQEAHRLLEIGDYAQAADAFERLADESSSAQRPRASGLFMQAAHACLLAGQAERSVGLLRQGLQLLADAGHWPVLRRAGRRATTELTDRGYPHLAEEIDQWLENTLPEVPPQPARPERAPRTTLPDACSFCGAPVRPDEVDWLDEHSGACAYCGNVIRGE